MKSFTDISHFPPQTHGISRQKEPLLTPDPLPPLHLGVENHMTPISIQSPLITNHPILSAIHKLPEIIRTLTRTRTQSLTKAILPVWFQAFDLRYCESCSLTTAHSSFRVLSRFVWRLRTWPFPWSWLLFWILPLFAWLPHSFQKQLAPSYVPRTWQLDVERSYVKSYQGVCKCKPYLATLFDLATVKSYSTNPHFNNTVKYLRLHCIMGHFDWAVLHFQSNSGKHLLCRTISSAFVRFAHCNQLKVCAFWQINRIWGGRLYIRKHSYWFEIRIRLTILSTHSIYTVYVTWLLAWTWPTDLNMTVCPSVLTQLTGVQEVLYWIVLFSTPSIVSNPNLLPCLSAMCFRNCSIRGRKSHI